MPPSDLSSTAIRPVAPPLVLGSPPGRVKPGPARRIAGKSLALRIAAWNSHRMFPLLGLLCWRGHRRSLGLEHSEPRFPVAPERAAPQTRCDFAVLGDLSHAVKISPTAPLYGSSRSQPAVRGESGHPAEGRKRVRHVMMSIALASDGGCNNRVQQLL